MQDREAESADETGGEPSPKVAAPRPGPDVREETPDAPGPPDPEAAKPSAMVEEGERPAPDRGSVEEPASTDRSGGMIGEG
ncbi:hypothetical protein BrevBR_01365 [Brevundimonas sp. BR2-1]|jgi:hypothetical protein|uniref:hypothetical protein n=1 Tax=Brevundimonas sp. BR2-1 TaxID=3031123 RepID=UPI0030A5191A